MNLGDEVAAEQEHLPQSVYSYDGMPFVECSCSIGHRPQSAVWLRDHWQGTPDDGVAALGVVIRRQVEGRMGGV